MSRKYVKEAIIINRIKKAAKLEGVSSRLVSLWTDVNYTTVSTWNNNTSQPTDKKLNEIGELLEIANRDLFENQERVNTGLGRALETELKRLHKEEKVPYEIEKFDKKKGVKVKVNNPELVRRLKTFAREYKDKKKL